MHHAPVVSQPCMSPVTHMPCASTLGCAQNDQVRLERLLNNSFKYLGIPELKEVPLAVMEKLEQVGRLVGCWRIWHEWHSTVDGTPGKVSFQQHSHVELRTVRSYVGYG